MMLGKRSFVVGVFMLVLSCAQSIAQTSELPVGNRTNNSTTVAHEATEQFSDFEHIIWQLTGYPTDTDPADTWAALEALESHALMDNPAYAQLLYFLQCHWAFRYNLPYQEIALEQFEKFDDNTRSDAAYAKCQQDVIATSSYELPELELNVTAYQALTETDPPLLVAWVAYDYAYYALDAGLTDQAMEATMKVRAIAEQSGLRELKSEALGLMALIEADILQVEEALATNAKALELAQRDSTRVELLMNRGWLLFGIDRLEEGLAAYAEAEALIDSENERLLITTGTNIAFALRRLGRMEEALTYTEALLERAYRLGDADSIAFVQTQRASVLLEIGEQEQALAMFSEAQQWFRDNKITSVLVENLKGWAELLFFHGMPSEAYETLVESIELNNELNRAKRITNTELMQAVVASQEQREEILKLEAARAESALELQQSEFQQKLWIIIISVAIIFTGIVVIAYLRLKRAHRELAEKTKQLDYESRHDPLTKLHNRRSFGEFMQSQFKNNQPALIVLLDLDHFKRINDHFGHDAGDEVLRIICGRIKHKLKSTDRMVRWGGEEFLIYLNDVNDPEIVKVLIQRILKDVQQPVRFNSTELPVTTSIGFLVRNISTQLELDEALSLADTYLYKAKGAGRNRAVGEHEKLGEICITPDAD
ncbi:tetratricopeptide repeat-containing diguanylate cyclase [Aliidiomarina shirensis]|nr:tetratricopeptide repeat-containing diguanylate cyclase [Aliidiomarina shirensis]